MLIRTSLTACLRESVSSWLMEDIAQGFLFYYDYVEIVLQFSRLISKPRYFNPIKEMLIGATIKMYANWLWGAKVHVHYIIKSAPLPFRGKPVSCIVLIVVSFVSRIASSLLHGISFVFPLALIFLLLPSYATRQRCVLIPRNYTSSPLPHSAP